MGVVKNARGVGMPKTEPPIRVIALEMDDERVRLGPRLYEPPSYWISLNAAKRWIKQDAIPITKRGP